MITIHLRDIDSNLVAAWETEFANEYAVTVSHGSIFDEEADAIVSPANSFGYMDGGIDLVYSNYFGWELQEALKALISEQHFGELPVGQAVIVPTKHDKIPFLISAPTMRMPGNVSKTANAYLAFRAALIAVHHHNAAGGAIGSILVPGLGTGIGEIPPRRAARHMKLAFDSVVNEHGRKSRNFGQIWSEHHQLLAFSDAP
jgi:O-acetyl-ADP-ribose deacetylase (regulator of RNase III)